MRECAIVFFKSVDVLHKNIFGVSIVGLIFEAWTNFGAHVLVKELTLPEIKSVTSLHDSHKRYTILLKHVYQICLTNHLQILLTHSIERHMNTPLTN